MDYQTKKVLKYINDNNSIEISISKLSTIFNDIDIDYLIEIIHFLHISGYIKFIDNSYIRSTNKGKTFFFTLFSKWLSENIIAILALIISIFAFIRTL